MKNRKINKLILERIENSLDLGYDILEDDIDNQEIDCKKALKLLDDLKLLRAKLFANKFVYAGRFEKIDSKELCKLLEDANKFLNEVCEEER